MVVGAGDVDHEARYPWPQAHPGSGMTDVAEPYIPGYLGLDLVRDGELLAAPADDDFWTAWNAYGGTLKTIGYGMRKVAGKWQVTFCPGVADKALILEVLGKIRQRTHDELMKRSLPKW